MTTVTDLPKWKQVRCDYCDRAAQYVDSILVYGVSHGMIYHCPNCQAWVGVHKGTNRPLGRLANAELRQWKMQAHKHFDLLWQAQGWTRSRAYKWLARKLNISDQQCHIGMMDVAMCKKVVKICKGKTENDNS